MHQLSYQQFSTSLFENTFHPLAPFLEKMPKQTTLSAFLLNLVSLITSNSDLTQFLQESDLQVILQDGMEGFLSNIYKNSISLDTILLPKENLTALSQDWFQVVYHYSQNVHKNFQKNKIPIHEIYNYFQHVEESNEDYIFQECLQLIANTNKYDQVQISYQALKAPLGMVKPLFLTHVSQKINQSKDSSLFKFTSTLFNGITNMKDIQITSNKKVKDCLLINFTETFSKGTLLYTSKILLLILDTITLLEKKKDIETLAEVKEIIYNTKQTLSQKQENLIKIKWSHSPPMTFAEYWEENYILPFPEKFSVIPYKKNVKYPYETIIKFIEQKNEHHRENFLGVKLINDLLDEDGTSFFNRCICLNQKNIQKIEHYKKTKRDLFIQIMKQVNYGFLLVHYHMINFYPFSVGKATLDAFFDVYSKHTSSTSIVKKIETTQKVLNKKQENKKEKYYAFKKHFTFIEQKSSFSKIQSIQDTVLKINQEHSSKLAAHQKKQIVKGKQFIFSEEIRDYYIVHL